MTTASRRQQINTKYKQINKVLHMFLPEIQTKSISLSASAQISILVRRDLVRSRQPPIMAAYFDVCAGYYFLALDFFPPIRFSFIQFQVTSARFARHQSKYDFRFNSNLVSALVNSHVFDKF